MSLAFRLGINAINGEPPDRWVDRWRLGDYSRVDAVGRGEDVLVGDEDSAAKDTGVRVEQGGHPGPAAWRGRSTADDASGTAVGRAGRRRRGTVATARVVHQDEGGRGHPSGGAHCVAPEPVSSSLAGAREFCLGLSAA